MEKRPEWHLSPPPKLLDVLPVSISLLFKCSLCLKTLCVTYCLCVRACLLHLQQVSRDCRFEIFLLSSSVTMTTAATTLNRSIGPVGACSTRTHTLKHTQRHLHLVWSKHLLRDLQEIIRTHWLMWILSVLYIPAGMFGFATIRVYLCYCACFI